MNNFPAAADWKVCVNGSDAYGYEIAICREAFEHGFQSWGWDGPNEKNILFVLLASKMPPQLWEVALRYKDEHLMKFAQACADAMNHVESQTLLNR